MAGAHPQGRPQGLRGGASHRWRWILPGAQSHHPAECLDGRSEEALGAIWVLPPVGPRSPAPRMSACCPSPSPLLHSHDHPTLQALPEHNRCQVSRWSSSPTSLQLHPQRRISCLPPALLTTLSCLLWAPGSSPLPTASMAPLIPWMGAQQEVRVRAKGEVRGSPGWLRPSLPRPSRAL